MVLDIQDMLARVQHAGKDHPTLGCITTCTITGVLHPVQAVRQMLEDGGLDAAGLPTITARLALSRALDVVARGHGDVFLRKIVVDDAHSCHVLVREKVDRVTEEPTYEVALKVVHDKRAGAQPVFSFSTPQGEQVLQPLIDRYSSHYMARDIAQALFWTMRQCAAVPLNLEGRPGAYFMPLASFDIVERLRAFVETLARETDTASSFKVVRVLDEEGERECMRMYAVKAVLDEIERLRGETARVREQEPPPAKTVAQLLQQIDEVGRKAALYRRILTLQIEDIAQALEPLRADYQVLLRGQSPFIDPGEVRDAQAAGGAWWGGPGDGTFSTGNQG